ncbi:MAG: hypothetical protein ACOC9E_05900 [Chloroflexota bacterium]
MADKEIDKLQGRRMVTQNTSRADYDPDLEKQAESHRADLQRIIEGGVATRVRILASHDCCPVCRATEGAYDFDDVPTLPIDGCSHPLGCRCHYAPVLDRFGP